jgi:hypothetical protein
MAHSSKLYKNAIRISLSVAITIYLLLIPFIIFTGGFKISFLGLSISATHLHNPIWALLLLIPLRIAFAKEWKSGTLFLGSILLAIVIIEILLRIHPIMLGDMFANKVLSVYHTGYSGIYEYDPVVKMDFMKPNFQTVAYWNGHRWPHKTDSKGFRNPIDREQAEIVLLGDSLIYGHGVNQFKTVGYFLEKLTGLTVSNLGRTGDCAFQQVYKLNRYGLVFNPKYVLYFFFNNDISDLTGYLAKEELQRFVDTPIEKISFLPRHKMKRKDSFLPDRLAGFFQKGLYLNEVFNLIEYSIDNSRGWGGRFYDRYLKRSKKEKEPLARKTKSDSDTVVESASENESVIPTSETSKQKPVKAGSSALSLEWLYTRHAILQMDYACRKNGARFIIIPITFGQDQYLKPLKDIATRHNIRLIDTHGIESNADYRLPNDGHFSGDGALAIAKIVSDFICKQDMSLVFPKRVNIVSNRYE